MTATKHADGPSSTDWAALPLATAAHRMFLASPHRGDGAADDSQVIRTSRALSGSNRPGT